MNIFKFYKNKIIEILKSSNNEINLKLPENLDSINVDVPPTKFNCDLSSNVAMILSKPNNKSPMEIGDDLAKLIKNKEKFVEEVTVEKPGFINIKLNINFWNYFLEKIINESNYGSQKLLNQKNI